MNKTNIKISARQLMLLKLSGITGTIFFGAVRAITTAAGAHGYLAIVGGGIMSFLVVVLSVSVGRRFPNQTPFQYSKLIYGKWIGGLLSLALIIASLTAGAFILRSLGDFLITAILPETPLSANIGLMLLLVCVGAYMGLEVLARFNEAFTPIVLVSWLIIVALSVSKIDFGWFRPLFDIELGRLGVATLLAGTLLIDALIELMFYPFVRDQRVVLKYCTWSVVIGTAVILALQMAVIGVFSPALASAFTFPLLQLAQDATLGVSLERMEAIFLILWIIGTFIRVSTVFYGASLGLAQTLGLKNHRFFIPPLAIGVFYVAFQPSNVPQSFNYDAIFNQVALVIQIGLVSLLLLGAIIRRKKGSARDDTSS